MKIIVADDHSLFREGLSNILRQLDPAMTIVEAGDHEAALQAAKKNADADLVLLDLSMPGHEPVSALRAMLAQCPTVPIVVLSGNDDLRDVRAVLDAGAMGFIPKSETAGVILSAIRLVLAGGIYMPAMLMKNQSRAAPSPGTPALTPRQHDVLRLLAEGKSNKEIGRELDLSESTVKVHLVAIFRELNVGNRTEAMQVATARGLLKVGA